MDRFCSECHKKALKPGHLAKCKRISCDGHCQWPNCPVKQETKKRERNQRVEESNAKKKVISNKRKLLEILKDNARLKSNNNITSFVRGNYLLLILRNYSWTRSSHCWTRRINETTIKIDKKEQHLIDIAAMVEEKNKNVLFRNEIIRFITVYNHTFHHGVRELILDVNHLLSIGFVVMQSWYGHSLVPEQGEPRFVQVSLRNLKFYLLSTS